MYAQGKFFNGGCGLARCGLCDFFTPSYRQKRDLERLEYEYDMWLSGVFDDMAETTSLKEEDDDIGAAGYLIVSHIFYSNPEFEPWVEEFKEWYKPEEWFNSRRAACSFVVMKLSALKKERDDALCENEQFRALSAQLFNLAARINCVGMVDIDLPDHD